MKLEDMKRLARAYQEVTNPQPIEESHFKVGDEVYHKDGEGKVVAVDKEEKGAYYTVELENGKRIKAKPEDLKADDDDDDDDDEDDDMKEAMDPVNHKALKKDFKDRGDKDIDNDGDVDKSDEYLHKRRKAVSKAVKGETATMNPKLSSDKSTSSEQKESVEEKFNWKVSHAGKHVYVKAPNVGSAMKKAQKGYGNMDITNAKVKNLGKVGTPANETVNTADKKPEQYLGPDGKMHTRMVPAKKDVVKKESTIRDRLMAILGERKDHGNTDQKQPYDDNWSPNAKKMAADHKAEVQADATKAAADTAAAATKPVKVAAKRTGDNTNGDKSVVNPVKDTTKGGIKESLAGIINAYRSIGKKD